MKKTFTTSIQLLLLVLLSGCGTDGFRYYKPGVSQQQSDLDAYECRQQATYYNQTATGNAFGGVAYTEPMVNVELAKSCLRARGYHITEE